jgi:uridine kinase
MEDQMGNSRVVCIAGGSGCGKSTLAENLVATLGEGATVLALDEYQKSKAEVPRTVDGQPNYDHPDAVDFPRFVADLTTLRAGAEVTLVRRHKRLTMGDGVVKGETFVVRPAPLIIVEGYLSLWSPEARSLYDFMVYLDLPAEQRVERRRWAKDAAYVTQVLLPMHDLYIEPTRKFADLSINVAVTDAEGVRDAVLYCLQRRGFIK